MKLNKWGEIMIKKFRKSEIRQFFCGLGIFSALWILGVLFSGEIYLADTINIGGGNPVLSKIFPFVFSAILIGVACFSKRYGAKVFFKTSYIIAALPMVCMLLGLLLIWGSDLFNNIDWLESVLGYTGYFLMLFAVPVTSAAYTFVDGPLFFLGFGIFVLSLIISLVCYLTIKEKNTDRP